ncbi:hypothetical protein M0R45_035382 [Rubus argutus]|uniref:Uncharacterized protein n=1 Tax=Rubus argutus TaxID=59490 RepID=A0AAW1VVH1_RUBAR
MPLLFNHSSSNLVSVVVHDPVIWDCGPTFLILLHRVINVRHLFIKSSTELVSKLIAESSMSSVTTGTLFKSTRSSATANRSFCAFSCCVQGLSQGQRHGWDLGDRVLIFISQVRLEL